MKYDLVRNKPVAKFFYQGNHTHPVRRTVLIIENTSKLIVGYELREGNDIRSVKNAPIKSYRKDRIAKTRQLRLENPRRADSTEEVSTYQRETLISLLEYGI